MPKITKPHTQISSTVEAEALFESIGEGAVVTNARARISRINRAALQILGYKEEELIGKWFPSAIKSEDEHGNSIPNLERPMTQAFITGQDVSARSYYRRRDGSRVPVSFTVSPVLVDGKPIGAIEVFRDISHEIALERAKDEFVAIASHQLRTPATAVKQYVGLLLEGYAEPLAENQKLFLERAYESNERQLQIVQEILNVSQLDLDKLVLRPQLTDVRELAGDAIATVQSKFNNKEQTIKLQTPAEPVLATIDKNQIRIALENLLENASNYTWSGKNITIKILKSKDQIKISVKDEGVGIEKADITKLFQKFSRIPNPLSVEIGGTGLGLYWAARIVELHGGKIKVSSKINQGSTFTIYLPADD